MTRRNRRTVSISLADRGQTTQDFAIGIGVFVLAIAFVFSFVPSIITPFSSSVGSGDAAQADRIAATAVDNLSTDPDRPNHLDWDTFDATYNDTSSEDLVDVLGLRATGEGPIDRVSISIETLNQSEDVGDRTVATGGSTYDRGRAAASASRLVTIDLDGVAGADPEDCTPACRLVVRVW